MPGTPLPARRSRNSTGALRSNANKENAVPQDELQSPGDIMSKEKRASRVSRRVSVLKILGRTESEISPCAEPEQPAADAKRRRTSRVSFGNIQTAIYQKDSEWNNTPSPAVAGNSNQGNLSTLPDDSGFASPGPAEQSCVDMELTGGFTTRTPAATEESCVDMSLTGGFTNRTQPLSSLPPVDDMFQNDTSLASFGEPSPARPRGEGFAPSLADLVAEDEREDAARIPKPTKPAPTMAMEFRSAGEAEEAVAQKPADLTDHELTKDIPTRAIPDHTGAFLPLSRRGSDVTGAGMELTTAYGGIVHVQRSAPQEEEGDEEDEEAGMEMTAAYGGIVAEGGKRRESMRGGGAANTSAELQELTGTLSRIRKSVAGAAEGEAARAEGAGGEGAGMETTGTFGRIIAAISADGGGAGEEEEEEEERTAEVEAGADQRTYVDGEVTMFTPLSRIKRRAAGSNAGAAAAEGEGAGVGEGAREASPEPAVEGVEAGGGEESSPPAMRTRSRSRTPTRAASQEAEAGGGRARSGGAKRRRSGAAREREAQVQVQVPLEAFLEEMGIRFLTHAKTHTRKSSFCPPPRAEGGAEPGTAEKLREVLVAGTEVGQLRNNAARLRAMSAALAEEVAGLEKAASERNPAVVREGMREGAEGAMRVQGRMKALKKSCRVASELRWTHWRDTAQREVEEALGRVKQAVEEDLGALRGAAAAAGEAREEEARRLAANRVGELGAQLGSLREAEAEQEVVLASFAAQLATLTTRRESLEQQLAAEREPAPLPSDDEMLPLVPEAAPPAEELRGLAEQARALEGLAVAVPRQLSPGGMALQLPGGRVLSVGLSPGGAVAAAALGEERGAARGAFEAALWEGAGCRALVEGLVYPVARPATAVAGVVEEVALRCRRLEALLGELRGLQRRHQARGSVGPQGEAQVEVVAFNPGRGSKVALTFRVAWHYPAGPLPVSAAAVMGEVDEEAVADAALRHCSGPGRISRIVEELCAAA